ncbi:MAG: AbrB/MazE/SpoVT family DNA-binding domain-containing protein [Myxococcales bacterium]|nr:AbrB/MazE/SpoVT family DNA-binding domain-containing protein [Myxococcales bacterium]
MSKVTSKLQVTISKAVAERHRIVPGSEVFFESAGREIRVRVGSAALELSPDERLRLFDEATARQVARDAERGQDTSPEGRGWTRDELYGRALPR